MSLHCLAMLRIFYSFCAFAILFSHLVFFFFSFCLLICNYKINERVCSVFRIENVWKENEWEENITNKTTAILLECITQSWSQVSLSRVCVYVWERERERVRKIEREKYGISYFEINLRHCASLQFLSELRSIDWLFDKLFQSIQAHDYLKILAICVMQPHFSARFICIFSNIVYVCMGQWLFLDVCVSVNKCV